MTSLALQLKKLKTAATQSLDVIRDRSSLLFDAKQAAAYDRQEFYELALDGLAQLKQFDDQFDTYEPELFSRKSMNFNRTMVNNEENEDLNESLERMITRLVPYFNHRACKQVFEWLIYKYQVHRFNAEFLFVALLPYHTSNSFGRLLSILRFEKPEWNFVEEYAKDGLPIPMNVLMKVCHANRSYFLVTVFSNFFVKATKSVGKEYMNEKLHPSFTFFAIFMMNLFEDSGKVDDQLIARVLPYVGVALKSKVLPFKYAGLVIVAKIVTTTALSPDVLNNIVKLILLKMRDRWKDVALDTIALIRQTQDIADLPSDTIALISQAQDARNLSEERVLP